MDTKALRQKILDLAIRGKLVPQDPSDEPASALLERIREQKRQMVREGKLKTKDIKNDTVIFVGEDNLHYEKFPDGSVKCIEDEIPFEVPSGWEWTRLGAVGDWGAGATPSRNNPDYYGGNIPWLKTGDLNDNYITEIPESISDLALKETSVRLNPAGSVLIAMYGATIGKLGILTFPATTNQACCACITFDRIDQKYLFYFLLSQREAFIYRGVGGAQPNISKEKIISTLFPVPPYKEQHRIAVLVDKLFLQVSYISRGKDDISDAILNLKKKILDLAIRGKLVPQDPNDEPASVLLERIRAEKEELIKPGKIKRDKGEGVIFKDGDNSHYRELPENWVISSLSEITTPLILNDGDWILSDNMAPVGEVKLIQLGSVGFLNYIDKGFKYLTSDEFDKLNCTEIQSGYMLINRIVSDSMNACILPDIDGRKITTVDTCWVAPRDDWFDIKYLLYAISSPSFQSLVMLNSSGTTRKRISKTNLISLPLMLPPLPEQRRIVSAIDSYFALLDKISENLA